MQLPYIKYVETLVAGRLEPSAIHDRLRDVNLELPLPAVSVVYNTLSEQQPEYFDDKSMPPDMDWLMDLEIDKMYGHLFNTNVPSGTLGIQGAFNVMDDPLMYRLITSLAMARITNEDIELIVNGKYNISYASEDIKEFLHYFFNVKDGDLSEKKEYVETIQDKQLKSSYKLALKGDKDYLVGKLGAAPDKSFDSMLRDMMTDSYYNFKERSRIDPELAQKGGTLAIRLTDRLEKLEAQTEEKKNLFDDVQFKINEIAGEESKKRHLSEVHKDG